MNQENEQRYPSKELAEKFLRAIAISQTAYELNNGYGLRKGDPLRFIEDSALANNNNIKPLNLSIPEGFIVAGVHKNPTTGLDAFIAVNRNTGEIQVGIAGTNGFGNDSPDTKEDLMKLGANHALELYQRPEFIRDLSEAIDSIGGISNLRNLLIAGQSLGGGVATPLGQLLVFGASKSNLAASSLSITIPAEKLTVIAINAPGNEYASKTLGFSEEETLLYQAQVNPHRLVVWNSITNTYDVVSQLGGKFSGTSWALPVEVAQSVPELHRNGIGVHEALQNSYGDLTGLKPVDVPTIDHSTLTRNLVWMNETLPIANNYVSMGWASYVGMLFSKPGEGAAAMSLGLQSFAGIPKPLADVMGAVGELVLRYVPVANLVSTVQFLFGSYLTGQAIGSSSSPLPSFDADAVVGPSQPGWIREIHRQDTIGLPPIVIDRNPLDGTVVTRLPDGRSLEVHIDGTEILTHPDTGMAVIRPDRSGFLVLKDTDPATGDTLTSTVIITPSTILNFQNNQWTIRRILDVEAGLMEQTTYDGHRSVTEDLQISDSSQGGKIKRLSQIPFVEFLPPDTQPIDEALRGSQVIVPISKDHVQLVSRDEDRRLLQTIDIKTIDRYRTEKIVRDGEGKVQRTVITEALNDSATRTRTLDADGNEMETTVVHTYRSNGEIVTLTDRILADGTRTLTTRDNEQNIRSHRVASRDETPAELAEAQTQELHQDVADFLTALRQKDTPGMILATARIALDYAHAQGMVTARFDGLVGGVSNGLALVSSLNALRHGDTLARLSGSIGLINSTNYFAANYFGGSFLSAPQINALSTAGAILSIANLANLGDMIEAGQAGSAAASVISAVNAVGYLAKGSSLVGAGALIPINPIAMVVAAFVLDKMFASDPPPPPPVGTARFIRKNDGTLGYEISNANGLGRRILTKELDELVIKVQEQLVSANQHIDSPEHRLALVIPRMPAVHISSWPSYVDNGVSNYFFAIEQADPMRDDPNWMGVARQDLVGHYSETLLLPEAIVQQWEVDHLRAAFGNDEAHWQTEGAWLRAKSPIEQERSRLQAVFEQAQNEWEAASHVRLVLSAALNEVQAEASNDPLPTVQERREAARIRLEAARVAVNAYNEAHPVNPTDAARASATEEAEFARTRQARETIALQWTKLIAIDIGNDGISISDLLGEVGSDLDSILHQQVARFDVDDDGFREATQWIAPTEAILGIDRSGNGVLDNGNELFNSAETPFDQHGLPSLAYFDANADGKITRDDPVYRQLRLWVDLDGDGSSGALEVFTMKMQTVALEGMPEMGTPSPMAIEAIDLQTQTVTYADGTNSSVQTVNLLSHVKGLQIVQHQDIGNLNVLHEDGLHENFVTLVADMGALTELQSTSISAERRAELQALARRYGLNPDAAEFASIVRSLVATGAGQPEQDTVIYFGNDDVWVDPSLRERLAQRRISFRKLGDPSASIAGENQLVRLGQPLDAQALGSAGTFDDRWVASRVLSATEVISDQPLTPQPASPLPELPVAPAGVYSLLQMTKGAQEGGLVTQWVAVFSDPQRPELPPQTVNVLTTTPPVAALTELYFVGNEDASLSVSYAQLEQRALLRVGAAAGSFRVLGIRSQTHGIARVDDLTRRVSFRPDANFSGDASLTVVLADAHGAVYEQRLNVHLNPVNDAPQVTGEQIVSAEDIPLLIDGAMLLLNDRDPEANAMTVTGIGRVALGKAELLGNGMIHYTPPSDQFNVTDTVEYFVSDALGATSVAKLRITLNGVADAPTVVAERVIHAREDQVLRIAAPLLLANDFDPDTDARRGASTGERALRIAAVGSAEHGEVRLEGTEIVFRPEQDYHGTAFFSYTVMDEQGLSTTGRAEIQINPVSDVPLAAGEHIDALEDEPLIIDTALLLANEMDADILRGEAQTLTVVALDQVEGGTAQLRNGQIMFTPEHNRAGQAGFRYTVSDGAGGLAQASATITLAPVNDAPVVQTRQVQAAEDQPLSVSIQSLLDQATDVDDEHGQLRFAGLGEVTGGMVHQQDDQLIFTPDADFFGTASFSYRVADAQGLTGTGVCAIDINNINDAPLRLEGVSIQPVADEDQEIRIAESALLQLFIDHDGDALSVLPESLSVQHAGDSVRFDAERRELVFRGAPHAHGERQLSFAVTDGQTVSHTATVAVMLRALNDAPEVRTVGFQMLEDGGVTDPTQSAWTYISHDLLLSGASDPDGDTLSLISVSNGKAAGRTTPSVVQVENDPVLRRVRIKAPLNYVGAIDFEFTVSDGNGGQTTQRALGSVEAVNDNPRLIIRPPRITKFEYRGAKDKETRSFALEAWDPELEQTTSLSIKTLPTIGGAKLSNSRTFNRSPGYGATHVTLPDAHGNYARADLTTYSKTGSRTHRDQQVHIEALDSAGGSSIAIASFTAYSDPIVIDLDNDGLEFIDLDHSQVRFDTDGSGESRRMAWVSGDDGILAYDVDGNGQITRFDEISFWSHVNPQTPGMSDLQALQRIEFDSNQDGVFDARDDKWRQFMLWRDRNGNGHSDEGELQTMEQAGLRQLYLNGNVLNRAEGPDALVRGYTRVVTHDGRLLQAADVWLNVDDGTRPVPTTPPAPPESPASAVARALEGDQLGALLEQLANTPTGSNHAPLLYGYLPTQYADEGDVFRLEIAPNLFIDPDAGDGLHFEARLADGSPLPDWLRFDPLQLRFDGTPSSDDAAQLQVMLRATDPHQASTTTVFNLIVSPANHAPEVAATLEDIVWLPEQMNVFTLPDGLFSDTDALDELLIEVSLADGSPLPDWLHFDSWERTLRGMPSAEQLSEPVSLRVMATDLSGAQTMSFTQLLPAPADSAVMIGTTGDDAYLFSHGDGWRTLLDPFGDDLIRIDFPTAETALRLERQGDDLSLTVEDTRDGMLISGWYTTDDSGVTTHQIERLQLSDGRTLLSADVNAVIAAQSTAGAAAISAYWR